MECEFLYVTRFLQTQFVVCVARTIMILSLEQGKSEVAPRYSLAAAAPAIPVSRFSRVPACMRSVHPQWHQSSSTIKWQGRGRDIL